VVGWSCALIAILLLGLFGMLEVVAHRPSPVHATLTTAEINEEDAYLKQSGLIVPDGRFLKEHPFEPPWTSHSLLLPSSWSRQPGIKTLLGSRRVRADLLLSDLDVLEPVMHRAYGGWDSAEARGWNWNQWFADWRKRLAVKGAAELPFDEAFAAMDALIAFQRDNHTQIPLNRQSTSAGSQTAVLASAPSAACVEIRASGQLFPIAVNDAGQQVRTAKLWKSGMTRFADTSYISMPSSYGTPEALRCGDTWIPLQPITRAGGMPRLIPNLVARFLKHDRTQIERLGDGIAYARLPDFNWSNYENVSREGWAHRQPGDRVLIVDLRDNGGGDGNYGLETLKGWIDESHMVRSEDLGMQLNSSCLYAPLRWNRSIGSAPTILPGQKAFLQDLLDRMAKPNPPGCPRTEDTKPPRWTYLQRRFDPKPGDLRIIALVNSHCGSDCEWITAELASLPQTIVVGANTFGVFQFVQPGYSVLPHTGLPYRIALGRSNDYGDDRSVDGYGLDVDVVLPEVDSLTPEQLRELVEIVAKL
jgi:Peptidase family S41